MRPAPSEKAEQTSDATKIGSRWAVGPNSFEGFAISPPMSHFVRRGGLYIRASDSGYPRPSAPTSFDSRFL
jgi:hypothetical protein